MGSMIGMAPLDPLRLRVARSLLSDDRRRRVYAKLGALVENGISLAEALRELSRRAREVNSWAEESFLEDLLVRAVRRGDSLGQVLSKWAPVDEVMIIEGNSSSNLGPPLAECVKIIKIKSAMITQVKGALAYPLFLASVLCGALFVVGRTVLPQFLELADPSDWTGAGWVIYKLSLFLNSGWIWVALLSVVSVVVLVIWSLPHWCGPLRQRLDKLPPWSIYRLLIGSSWMLSISALLSSGIPLVEAMSGIQGVSRKTSPWLAERLARTLRFLHQGKNLGEALRMTGYEFPDKELIADLSIYSRLDDFEVSLGNLADEWVQTGVQKVKEQAAVAKAIMFVLVGAMYFLFLAGVMSIQRQSIIPMFG